MRISFALLLLVLFTGCGASTPFEPTVVKNPPMQNSPGPDFRTKPSAPPVPPTPAGIDWATCTPVVPDPQPPTCAWRDLVVCRHMAWGGARNDIVTLSDGHRVFIQDTGGFPGYRLVDYPSDWCAK